MLSVTSHLFQSNSFCLADIAGANATGWSSILVETGVYDPARGPPTHEPTHIAKDVERAVKWAVDREFAKL